MTGLNAKFRSTLKKVLPPIITDAIRKRNATWRGDYNQWETVSQECSGYEQGSILEKVDQATEQVVRGEFPYERDSVLFKQVEYSWPLLTGLLWSHGLHGELNVLDFGGSLGSTYHQNKKFLVGLKHTWNIIEQEAFVALGKRKYQTTNLRFHDTIDECVKTGNINTFVTSSTLQYLPEPIQFLREVTRDHSFPIIILDRLSIIDGAQNRLTKQTVSAEIYQASYPCWFFSEEKILEPFKDKYELIEKFDSHPFNETYIDGKTRSSDHGFIFKLK